MADMNKKTEITNHFFRRLDAIAKADERFLELLLSKSGEDWEYYKDMCNGNANPFKKFKVEIDSGATKGIVIFNNGSKIENEYIIKTPLETDSFGDCLGYNYCDIEVDKYDIICNEYDEKYVNLFAESWYAGDLTLYSLDGKEVGTVPIYIMKRAYVDSHTVRRTGLRFIKRSNYSASEQIGGSDNYTCDKIPANCLALFYGLDVVDYLVNNILLKEHINDIHIGNIGFIKSKPVIIDYSGYYGD